jgi:choline kinase
MKYIIMCGGSAFKLKTPKPLTVVAGETLLERTMRLLRDNGIEDIAISSTNKIFDNYGVPRLEHFNPEFYKCGYSWLNAFYPVEEPVCYVFGDVYFSPEAIKKIVETETDDIEFFASAPPFSRMYAREWAEPYGFKAFNYKRFLECVAKTRALEMRHKFLRPAIAWELWQVIKNTPLNQIIYTNYTAINDYTVDIDDEWDVKMLEELVGRLE